MTGVQTCALPISCGISGLCLPPLSNFDPNIILDVAMGIIAVFANMTAFARINHCRKELIKK